MGKSRRLKAERRREHEAGSYTPAQTSASTPASVPTPPTATSGFTVSNVQPSATPAARATTPRTEPAADLVTRGLLAIAVVAWVLGHLVPNGSLSAVLGAIWGTAGILLGWRSPAGGLLLGLALAPFISGPLFQPVAEFLRAAPIWGSLARLLTDRLIAGRFAPGRFAPSPALTLAATAAMILFPITRITAQANGHGSAETVFV